MLYLPPQPPSFFCKPQPPTSRGNTNLRCTVVELLPAFEDDKWWSFATCCPSLGRCGSLLSRARGNPSIPLPPCFISGYKWTCVLPCRLIFIHSGSTLSLCAKGSPPPRLSQVPSVSPVMSQLRCVGGAELRLQHICHCTLKAATSAGGFLQQSTAAGIKGLLTHVHEKKRPQTVFQCRKFI